MKFLHRIKAHFLRKKLIHQRAQNIADLRRGRREARHIAILLAREIRLSGYAPKVEANIISMPRQKSATIGRMPDMPRLRKI